MPVPTVSAAERLTIAERYSHTRLDPTPAQWQEVFRAMDAGDSQIHVIEASKPRPGHGAAYLATRLGRNEAAIRNGGTPIALNRILQPGTGDMLPWMSWAGGLLSIVAYPSRAAWLRTLLEPESLAANARREDLIEEVMLLVAGADTIPGKARRLLGKPKPPTAFRTPRIDGKRTEQIVDDLLAIYPDGGADPSRAQLERMMTDPRFRTEPVFYLNLYDFGDGTQAGGEAEHRAYNTSAFSSVRANGAMPIFRTPVVHALVSPVNWDLAVFVRWPSMAVFTDLRLNPEYVKAQEHRAASAVFYGNFMTFPAEGDGAAELAEMSAGGSGERFSPATETAGPAARVILGAIGAFSIARGLFHWLSPDSGAGSVAGMDLSGGNRDDVVYLLGITGIAQLGSGIIDVAAATKLPQAAPLALGIEALKNGLVLATESGMKKPVKPVPGRYAHAAVAGLALLGLLLARRRR
ncbi:MAG: hypothetical protein ACKOWF_01430 [Chloroflexota bacterium]